MVLFEVGGPGPGFAGERLYALANDQRAWQAPDAWRDPGGDDARRLYTCRASDQRPEEGGVPWRSFGLMWCRSAQVQAALGAVKPAATDGAVRADANFLQYEYGRAFRIAGITYVVYAPNGDGFVEGVWERP